jgi:orotidine-5'-phosphate decarboxylase
LAEQLRHFADRLTAAVRAKGTPAVVGLDPVLERLPPELQPRRRTLQAAAAALESFCREVIALVAPIVPAVKLNAAFFEVCGGPGVAAYMRLVGCAHRHGLLVIGDVKRGDIGSTAEMYAAAHLGTAGFSDLDSACIADAITVSGYLGQQAVEPFIRAAAATGRGIYVLLRPSDPGADQIHQFGSPRPFYQFLAELVREWGEKEGLLGSCGLSCIGAVVAPKDPQSTRALRAALPRTPFLVPGYGAQGADVGACRACFLPDGTGAVINASRLVIYAYQRPEFSGRFGNDWQACIEAAARQFAADVATVLAPASGCSADDPATG